MKTVTVNVKLSPKQAARFEMMADALRMDPGALIKTLALSGIDGWSTAGEFLDSWQNTRDAYANAAVRFDSSRIDKELAAMFGGGRKVQAA